MRKFVPRVVSVSPVNFRVLRRRPIVPAPPLAAACVLVSVATLSPAVAVAAEEKNKPLTYDEDVLPILRANCAGCHNADKQEGGLNMTQFAALMQGGGSGEVISAGDGEFSYLYMLAAHESEPVMPPNGQKMAAADLATLKNWIDSGARENAGSKVKLKPKEDLSLGAAPTGRPEGPPPMPPDPYAPLAEGDPQPLSIEAIPVDGRRASSATGGERADAVTALAASPWAPLLAVAGEGQVTLFHADTRQPWGVLPFPEGRPMSLKFSTNGRLLIAGGGRGAYRGLAVIWDVTTGARVAEVGDEPDAVLCADLSPDQSLVAIGTTAKRAKVLSVATGEILYTVDKPTDWALSVAFSPDGVLLAVGDRGGNLSLWEAASGLLYADLRGHKDAVTALSWRADSNLLASAGLDDTVHLWNPEDGGLVRKVDVKAGGVEDAAFFADGTFAAAGRNGEATLWDINGKRLRAFPKRPDFALSVAAADEAVPDQDGKLKPRLFVGDWTGVIAAYDPAGGEAVAEFSPNPPPLPERLAAAEAELKELTAAAEGVAKRRADAAAALEKAKELKETTAGKLAAIARERDAAEKSRKRLSGELAQAKRALSDAEKAVRQAEQAAAEAKIAWQTAILRAADADAAAAKARDEQEQAVRQLGEAAEAAAAAAEELAAAADSAEGEGADAAEKAAAEAQTAADEARKRHDTSEKAAEEQAAADRKALEAARAAEQAAAKAYAVAAVVARDAARAAKAAGAETEQLAAELAAVERTIEEVPKALNAAKKAADAANKAVAPAEQKKKEADALEDPAPARDAAATRLAELKVAAERAAADGAG